MGDDLYPKLLFDYTFDEMVALDVQDRGFWEHSKVQLENYSLHPIVFYCPTRLAQDLEEDARHGRPFVIEKGLIVVQSVTRENMERAVSVAAREGFFSR